MYSSRSLLNIQLNVELKRFLLSVSLVFVPRCQGTDVLSVDQRGPSVVATVFEFLAAMVKMGRSKRNGKGVREETLS